MAVPAGSSWPRWVGEQTVLEHKQNTVKHCENISQDQELEDSQKSSKLYDLWDSADAINHVVNRAWWNTLPNRTLGVLWSFDESVRYVAKSS